MACLNMTEMRLKNHTPTGIESYDFVYVPCGKCTECLKSRARAWQFRLLEEQKTAESTAFITLTFEDEYLPLNGVSKREAQLFLKSFRKELSKLGITLRYYLIGDYGEQYHRPHYHFIAFFSRKISEKSIVNLCSKAWHKGNVVVGTVNIASIRYVTNYILHKKQVELDLNDTFSLMSRRPALGSNYLTKDMVEYLNREDGNFEVYQNGRKQLLPRYYRDKAIKEELRLARRAKMYRLLKDERTSEDIALASARASNMKIDKFKRK